MKKIILSVACLAVFSACNNQNSTKSTTASDTEAVASVSEVDTDNVPAFKFEKSVYDFGQITDGEKVSYDFKFKNIGKSPLIITSATSTCGCTVPEYPKEPVAPGAEGLIRVVFNSAGKPGMQNKIVTITANTIPSNTELNILGNVKAAKTSQN